jgi:P-type conjugative transfer protein TrbJ
MWTRSSTHSPRPSPRNSRPALAAAALLTIGAPALSPSTAEAQVVVFDPKNQLENAAQAARQLESLANEARMLAGQARSLAASPYSHLGPVSGALREVAGLSASVKGLASESRRLEAQLSDLYPTAVEGLDPRRALARNAARNRAARETAADLARAAADLDRLAAARAGRVEGALAASQAAPGQTAAIQASAQLLAVLAEDLASLRVTLLAQSRLAAGEAARAAAERAQGAEARRRFWGRQVRAPDPPAFEPFQRAGR